jgi:hypothetical protein
VVNSRIDHDHPHPAHQDHFKVFNVPVLEFRKIAENLHKAVVDYIHCLVIPVNIPEHGLKAIAIVFLVEKFLIPPVVFNAACYNVLQWFQSSKISNEYAASVFWLPA